ncbi:SDR family NAD(P)-dependent oxidoreductase [Spirillospora sp. NPDC000708]
MYAGTRRPLAHPETRAFLPAVTRSGGAIVNILSVNSLAPLPFVIPAYSVSKAAAFSMTQTLRAQVAELGVRVHAVLPGPVDTDMTRGADVPKAPGTGRAGRRRFARPAAP